MAFYNLKFNLHRWLSGSDLKKIVLFGCPSLEKRAVFAAKTLRNFFDIHENNVSLSHTTLSLSHFVTHQQHLTKSFFFFAY